MDGLTGFLAVITALSHWRVVVSLAVGPLAAWALAHGISWFTGGMGLWLVLLALGAGMLWEGSTAARAAGVPAQEPSISKPVAALGLCFMGFVWVGVVGWIAPLWACLVLLAAAPFAVGGLRALLYQRPVSVGYMVFAACALLSGVGTVWGLTTVVGAG